MVPEFDDGETGADHRLLDLGRAESTLQVGVASW